MNKLITIVFSGGQVKVSGSATEIKELRAAVIKMAADPEQWISVNLYVKSPNVSPIWFRPFLVQFMVVQNISDIAVPSQHIIGEREN